MSYPYFQFRHPMSFARLILTLLLYLFSASSQAQPTELSERLLLASPETIQADAGLLSYMNNLAESSINEHCAACHAADLTGALGVPNLVDYDWLWGITGLEMTATEAVLEIMQTILYGVRNTACADEIKDFFGSCPDTRYSEMPAYSDLGFDESRINNLVDYVLALGGEDVNPFAVEAAANDWMFCQECHAADGTGYRPFGGPDLTDDIWLYGADGAALYDVVANGRKGVCPAWSTQLDAATIKALAVYIYNKANGF